MPRCGDPRIHLPLLLALATACGDSTDPDDAPTAGRDIGEMARDEVEANLDALTLPSSLAPLGVGSGAAPCATASSNEDTDGDGIPNDATYTFTAPPCRFPGIRGSTLDIVGQLRVQDPAPTAAGFGYEAAITALRFTLVPDDGDDPSYAMTRNGTRSLTGTTAGLQLGINLQVIRTFPGQPDGSVEQQWTMAFTPETPLQINQPLPDGTLEVTGTLGWTRGTESFPLEVTTEAPLHYDSDCDEVQRIDEGELRATGDFAGNPGYVRIRWSDCGRDPEIVFVAEGG
jgi:hypothetical protein